MFDVVLSYFSISFIYLKYFIYYYYCVCVSASEHAVAWVWRSEGRFGVLVLSFHLGEKRLSSLRVCATLWTLGQ